MMRNLTEENLTDAVLAKLATTTDPRQRQIFGALVRHLHAFVREVELTEREWLEGIEFLTATGQKCDDKRQEFILLSDTLGVSMLVDAVNHRLEHGITETTVFGPFYQPGAPGFENGSDLSQGASGEPVYVHGHVRDATGQPIAGATLDIWGVDGAGWYDVQLPDLEGPQARGKIAADHDGAYRFWTIMPVSYPVPSDGPVGAMLKAMGRHPYRPAHVHFMVDAPGFSKVITHLFVEGDPYLDSDAVFGVKNSLITPFTKQPAGSAPDGRVVDTPYFTASYEFTLERI